MDGQGSSIEIANKYDICLQLTLLVGDKLNGNDDNKEDMPYYINQLFTNILDKREWINVDFAKLNINICCNEGIGYISY